MKTIVTIDFDVIMHRCISLYNDAVDDENFFVQDFLDRSPNSNFIPNADLYLYKYLTEYIIKCQAKGTPIKFIVDHHEMVDIIDNMHLEDPFFLYNVDFHHDIAYDEDEIKGSVEVVDCGNWVKYLFQKYKDLFNKYIWIKTKESEIYDYTNFFSRKFKTEEIDRFDFHSLSKKTDLLVICMSPAWVPHEQLELFKLWQKLFEQK